MTAHELRSWAFWARPEQIAPAGDWFVWLILAGRGFGKTRSAAEWIAERARKTARGRFALVAPTLDDVRDTMVEGESGLLSVFEPHELRGGGVDGAWNRTHVELYLAGGARFKGFSSEKARKLRGPQHHAAWADEASSWTDAHLGTAKDSTWSNLMLGLRLGDDPRVVVSTTPKKNALTRALMALPGVVVTGGSTYDNLDNLAPTFRKHVLGQYEGTALGRQELHAELLDEVPGALWTRDVIDALRVAVAEPLVQVSVGVDPNVGGEQGDACGIVAAGVDGLDGDAHGFVLVDRTVEGGPKAWSRAVARCVEDVEADFVVAEGNQGGELVKLTLQAAGVNVPVRVVYARRNKRTRASPVAMLYEQGRVHHVGTLAALEDELVT